MKYYVSIYVLPVPAFLPICILRNFAYVNTLHINEFIQELLIFCIHIIQELQTVQTCRFSKKNSCKSTTKTIKPMEMWHFA